MTTSDGNWAFNPAISPLASEPAMPISATRRVVPLGRCQRNWSGRVAEAPGGGDVWVRTEWIPFYVAHLKERVMQAAVVSVLLMAGACGDASEPIPAPAPTRITSGQS